jgi:hypothetical protein
MIGREAQELHKKEAHELGLELIGDTVRAWVGRRGQLLSAIETVVLDEPAHPLFWHREVGYGWLKHKYRLHPDWSQGPIDGEVLFMEPNIGGRVDGFPTGMAEAAPEIAHLLPRACDVSRTKIDLGVLSPINPFCEFPVREILGVSFGLCDIFGAVRADRLDAPADRASKLHIPRGPVKAPAAPPRNSTSPVNERAFEPWALSMNGYDRPITKGVTWAPAGWPEKSTALKLSSAELDRYRSRESLEFDPVELFDIHLEIDQAMHAKTLPPLAEPGNKPIIRILGASVERSDVSTVPFDELWLLGRCVMDGAPAWYGLSHIVSWDGDVLFGRETVGYPSKHGELQMDFDPLLATIQGRRLHRTFYQATVPLSLEPVTTGEESFPFLGIQILPPGSGSIARWVRSRFEIRLDEGRTARPEEVKLRFPTEPGPGEIGRPDPWFEFSGGRVVSAAAGRGGMRRSRGRIVGTLDDLTSARYLCDRMEGVPWPGHPYTFERTGRMEGMPDAASTFLVADLAVKPRQGRQR